MQKTVIFAVALVVMLSAAGCKKSGETGTESPLTASMAGAELAGKTSVSGESMETAETSVYPVGKKGDDRILPDVQVHKYTFEELAFLSSEELRLARNEICARHGRRFKSNDLNTYFSGKSWYHASVEADAFDAMVLNQMEKDNLEVIRQVEEKAAVLFCPKIGREEFPKLDGSTATLPLSHAIYRLSTGASKLEADADIEHGKTSESYIDLILNEGTDLVIAYEPGEFVKDLISENGDNIIMKPIGRDALVFLTNEKKSG